MKDFISKDILINTANAIRACENSNNTIAPKDFADRIRALDKLVPQPDALNFYMPNGGTITLNKIGTPTQVELEYSIDRGRTWTTWQEDNDGNRSLTITKDQKVFIRNTSETSTRFSTSATDYYNFAFTDDAYAGGNTNSLLCNNTENANLTAYVYRSLFRNCTTLLSPPLLPSTNLQNYCYYTTFYNCSSLMSAPELPSTTLATACYYYMFYGASSIISIKLPSEALTNSCYGGMFFNCISLNKVETNMINITAIRCLIDWLGNVSTTGDFYCPAELTIPTGASGIPIGWTRHDI